MSAFIEGRGNLEPARIDGALSQGMGKLEAAFLRYFVVVSWLWGIQKISSKIR